MSTADLINEILLGGLLGALGQGIRMAVGLKKLHTDKVSQDIKGGDTEEFSPSRLILSIFIGFVAGAIAIIIKGPITDPGNKDVIFTIMAAGYSGADFIEGVFNTSIAKLNAPANKANDNGQPENVADQPTPEIRNWITMV